MPLRGLTSGCRNLAIVSVLVVAACSTDGDRSTGPPPCTPEWRQWVEARLTTGDAHGHGPDIGSDEWQSVVEFKLGVRGDPAVPPRNTDAWCQFVDERIRAD
jgi:hypothetical protein